MTQKRGKTNTKRYSANRAKLSSGRHLVFNLSLDRQHCDHSAEGLSQASQQPKWQHLLLLAKYLLLSFFWNLEFIIPFQFQLIILLFIIGKNQYLNISTSHVCQCYQGGNCCTQQLVSRRSVARNGQYLSYYQYSVPVNAIKEAIVVLNN